MSVLRVSGLHAAYGPIKALHGVDLHVPSGSLTALLGVALVLLAATSPARADAWSDFVAGLWPDAQKEGVSRATTRPAWASSVLSGWRTAAGCM